MPYLETALRRTREALNHPRVIERFVSYFSVAGNFAGATFLEVGPFDPYAFVEGDLLALTLLEVNAQPAAVRRLLEPGPTRNELNSLLGEDVLPLDADLRFADADTLLAMEQLYGRVKRAVSPADDQSANWWVTASKLCARKRPDLFPVRDHVVCDFLGILKSGSYRIDWQVFRHLIQAEEVRGRLEAIVREAAPAPGVNIGRVNNRLRHLDVVLWMHARHGAALTY